jgi:hypothetical protein
MAIGAAFIAGCSTIAPGADPLIVRTEQTETFATNTFNTFLTLEWENQAFVLANAPYIHTFAESLRQPVMDGNKPIRQCYYWVLLLDRAKVAYQAGTGSSNQVLNALSAVETPLATTEGDIAVLAPASTGGAK